LTTDDEVQPESFRDKIATADRTGRRLWVYPMQPKGRLYTARTLVAAGLLIFLFAAPFIKIHGQPMLLFDLLSRNFIIFGLVFRPQDFYLFVLAILTLLVFVVLFTAIFGRLFCGWICPQTVFMEMVFRRIEYLIEGGPAKQRKLREGHWTEAKLARWILKQAVFFGLSFVVCNLLFAYIIGIDALFHIISQPISEHVVGFVAIVLFTLLFFWVFSWFREQACTLVCPYGRLQGVLLDSNSIQVAYDYNRGEPRAKFQKGQDRGAFGHCVTCSACVAVCPTGIDIRNGTQLECVNCTACIDACNGVMRRVGFPEGLIRYTSEARLKARRGFQLTGRVVVYTIALLVLSTLLTVLVVTRSDVQTTVLRTPGTLYYETEPGTIRNLYSLKLVNKTFDEIPIQLRLKAPAGGSISMVGGDLVIAPGGVAESAFFVDIPRSQVFGASTLVQIEILRGGEVIDDITTSFMGPDPRSGR
jgi:cytochrome c oxidase accessory protein FixG